jgi:hypothetical protein
MLIQKSSKLEVGEVVGMKLTTGEEIVAKLEAITDTTYELSKPLTLIPGQQGVQLIQTVMSIRPDVPLSLQKIHVIFSGPAVEQLNKYYLETVSGIQLLS